MLSLKGMFLSLMIVVLLPLSCTKLDQPTTVGTPERTTTLAEEQLPKDGSIPSKYGTLISVSSVAGHPYWMQLWFQDENGDFRMVRYSIKENRFHEVSHLIPRK